jgi:4-hydroxybenzoate polyprenyltransferase
MKRITDFFIYSNFFIAFCTALVTWQTLIIFSIDDSEAPGFILINFLSTFVLYNFQRLYYSAQSDESKYSWYNKNRRLVFTIIILLLALSFNFIWHFFNENKNALWAYIILSAFSLLYFLPPLQLRKIGILKPFFISIVFVFISVLMPLDFKINQMVVMYIVSQFAFIAALCVLFDIRDLDHDKNKKVNTFPVKFGETKTKTLTYVLLLIYIIFSMAMRNNILLFSSIITFIASWTLTFFANKNRPNWYYTFLVDGLMVLQALMLML